MRPGWIALPLLIAVPACSPVRGYQDAARSLRFSLDRIEPSLQLAFHMTGKAEYQAKALELLNQHGYLQNITNSMKLLHATKSFVHRGIMLGDEWNHSDDELAFITYWVLYRFALNDDLKHQYGAAIQDHWEFEKSEQSPFWNFVYAGCDAADAGVPGALWTLRGFPLDTVTFNGQALEDRCSDLLLFPQRLQSLRGCDGGGFGACGALAAGEFLPARTQRAAPPRRAPDHPLQHPAVPPGRRRRRPHRVRRRRIPHRLLDGPVLEADRLSQRQIRRLTQIF